jgi:GntR family transcriptional regulator
MQAELVIRIDTCSGIPAYRQIGNAIRLLLVKRSLKPGDVLPPVRQLAVDLAVHFNTVAEAYRTLADEGWLDLKRRRGALILDRPVPVSLRPRAEEDFAQRLRELAASARAEGLPPEFIARQLNALAEEIAS